MARQQPGLRAPDPADGGQVPTAGWHQPLWRACADHHVRPWWYSSRDRATAPGRFDLTSPDGTCYWATSATGAVLEASADPDQLDPPVLTVAAMAALTVWRAASVSAARSSLADVTRPSVPRLTAEIATIVPYDLPWAWADALARHGRTGLLYRGRFSFDGAVALFGPAGADERGPDAGRRPATDVAATLPPAFRAGIGTVGRIDQLPRARPPR